jgi:uncharacterized protein (TIGR02996 family)
MSMSQPVKPPMRRQPPSPLPIEPYFQALPGCEPFLQTIAEEPDEDLHRLVFADWLEEHGQAERAEFIRLQVESAATVGPNYLAPSRIWELLREHQAKWTEGLEHLFGSSWRYDSSGFARGMLEVMPLSRFVRLTGEEQRLLDVRCCLIDSTAPKRLETLLACDRLRFITALRATSKLGREPLLAIGAAATLTGLTHLELNGAIRPEGADVLTSLPLLGRLRSLALGYGRLGTSGFWRYCGRRTSPG